VFFGGDVMISYTIINQNGDRETEKYIVFHVGGINPEDGVAKSAIANTAGAPWYAWVVAKEESKGPTTKTFYNQFCEASAFGANGYGRVGEGFHNQVKEGNGWGMFQRDDKGRTVNEPLHVTRDQIWNWTANVTMAIREINEKYSEAKNTVTGKFVGQQEPSFDHCIHPNGTSGPTWKRQFTATEALGVTLYNGLPTGTKSGTFQYDTKLKRWSFNPPNAYGEPIPYIDKVMAEY
jgi:hypothetical protein